ncbi:hypothetical protein [Agromyces badenianii]|uniref:hypothetical protein n=1 Tax=Agromyces badenianii TaxID=2080742 RepID=UPI001F17968F|nr:hypothetical protein [Agromyces badenianii]
MSTSTQPTVPASRFVDELGDYLSVDKLAHWRLEGTGPKATKLGEPLRYSLENVLAWLRARTDRR